MEEDTFKNTAKMAFPTFSLDSVPLLFEMPSPWDSKFNLTSSNHQSHQHNHQQSQHLHDSFHP